MIELPRWFWRLVLHGVVLRTRPRRSARLYASIWEADGSPILLNSQAIVDALALRWAERKPQRMVVALGMRYGNPSMRQALGTLRDAGVTRIVILPLYPQYSAVTVGSAFDAVTETLTGWRRVPAVRFIDQYHANSDYIQALAQSIQSAWSRDGRPDLDGEWPEQVLRHDRLAYRICCRPKKSDQCNGEHPGSEHLQSNLHCTKSRCRGFTG